MNASEARAHAAQEGAAHETAPRLAGSPLLVIFTVVIVTLLALVFPTGTEYAAFTSETKPDAYSIAYLEVLTRANPKELDLRLVYAEQLSALGRYDDASAAVQPVLTDARLGVQAKNFSLDVALARARAIPEGDPKRAGAFADVHARLVDLLTTPRSAARSEQLAALALELDDPSLAAEYSLDLAARDAARRGTHLGNAARWMRAAGQNARAAEHYRLAHDATNVAGEQVDYAVLAVASLEAQDRVFAAADLAADYVLAHAEAPRILAMATRLATACSRASAARDFGRRLLTVAPGDDAAMRDQATRELAAGDAKASLVVLNKLVSKHPDEYGLRYQRARVAEWAGDLDTAERDLLWLVAHRRKGRAGQ